MSEASSQKVSQNLGTNAGAVQGVAAGRDAYADQTAIQETTQRVSKDEAVNLLEQIEVLLKSANLPSKLEDGTLSYVQAAQGEARKEEPRKQLVTGNLEGAIELLKNASGAVDSAKELLGKLKEPVKKLAHWLGVAASFFFG